MASLREPTREIGDCLLPLASSALAVKHSVQSTWIRQRDQDRNDMYCATKQVTQHILTGEGNNTKAARQALRKAGLNVPW
jgi:hypothetical protein